MGPLLGHKTDVRGRAEHVRSWGQSRHGIGKYSSFRIPLESI
jgi:hypothetical protein